MDIDWDLDTKRELTEQTLLRIGRMEVTMAEVEEREHNSFVFVEWLLELSLLDANADFCESCGESAILEETSHFQLDGVCYRCQFPDCRAYWSL